MITLEDAADSFDLYGIETTVKRIGDSITITMKKGENVCVNVTQRKDSR